jgi:hypothetical protein
MGFTPQRLSLFCKGLAAALSRVRFQSLFGQSFIFCQRISDASISSFRTIGCGRSIGWRILCGNGCQVQCGR